MRELRLNWYNYRERRSGAALPVSNVLKIRINAVRLRTILQMIVLKRCLVQRGLFWVLPLIFYDVTP